MHLMLCHKYITVLTALLVVINGYINTTEYLLLRLHIKMTVQHNYLQDTVSFIAES